MRPRLALLPSAMIAILLGILVGCGKSPLPPSATSTTATGGGPATPALTVSMPDNPSAEVGAELYASIEAPRFPPAVLHGTDPIVIPNCTVMYEDKQQLSAEVDGKIEMIASPMILRGLFSITARSLELLAAIGVPDPVLAKLARLRDREFGPGTRDVLEVELDRILTAEEQEHWTRLILNNAAVRDGLYEFRVQDGIPGGTLITFDPARPPQVLHPSIVFHPRDFKKQVPYWRLGDGDRVTEGQMLCLLDDQLVSTKITSALKIKVASGTALASSEEGVKLSKDKIDLDLKGITTAVVAKVELLNDQITLTRFVENQSQALQSIAKAVADYEEAMVTLNKHRITSRVDGIIRSVAKRPGEFVRAGEKIMEIQSTEKVRVEGNLDVQYFDQVKRDKVVSIEPAVPIAPVKSHAWHRQEVAGVAVTGHADRSLIVSVGLDGAALVWDPNLTNADGRPVTAHNLPHPVAVRAVGCTPPGGNAVLIVTGADDGKVRIWDATDPTKLPENPTREPADAHTSSITAIAISPDGKFAATAAGREVFIWDLEAGKKRYALPPEHRDTVTSLSFTPQTKLVTVSKDRSLKVWKLGADKVAVDRTVDHRSGDVDTLGVSPDGARVLFDQDKGRIDLVTLGNGQTTGQLSNVGPSVAFATLAIFGPDLAGFKLTDQSLAALRMAKVPETVLVKLAPLKDKELSREDFVREITSALNKEETERFQHHVLNHVLPPYTIVTAGGEGDLKGGLQWWRTPRAGGRGAEIARLITPGRVPVTCAAFSPHKERPFLVVGTDRGTVHVWTPPPVTTSQLKGRITNIEATDPRFVTVRIELPNKELRLLDRSAATVIVNPGR